MNETNNGPLNALYQCLECSARTCLNLKEELRSAVDADTTMDAFSLSVLLDTAKSMIEAGDKLKHDGETTSYAINKILESERSGLDHDPGRKQWEDGQKLSLAKKADTLFAGAVIEEILVSYPDDPGVGWAVLKVNIGDRLKNFIVAIRCPGWEFPFQSTTDSQVSSKEYALELAQSESSKYLKGAQ